MTNRLFLPIPLLILLDWTPVQADCEQGRLLFEAARSEASPAQRIELLHQSTAACPDPVAFGDLATAYLGVGDHAAALFALRSALESSGDPKQQVQIHALMANVYLEQDCLAEAIAAIGSAFDQAGGPVPDWVMDLRRTIDTHPERGRLSAEQIDRSLTERGIELRSFRSVPKLDLYILFDFDGDQPNAQGLVQVDALSKALETRAERMQEQYRIIGHTDKQGDAAYNQRLSERRAQSVRRLIEQHRPGLAGRLLTEGRGESKLKYPGDTPEDHRLNRRVEICVVADP